MAEVLNPSDVSDKLVTEDKTKLVDSKTDPLQKRNAYLAIDAEMDQIRPTVPNDSGEGVPYYALPGMGQNIPIKVSVVDERGILVLDTLIRPCVNGIDYDGAEDVPGYKSLEKIHGIKPAWLKGAPTLAEVRDHINMLCGKKQRLSVNEDALKVFEPITPQNYD